MTNHYCIKCHILGRVQGVWFRGSTQTQAIRLNLSGYARNLPDGSVEVLACGAAESLAIMRQWLQQGPSNARVDGVKCKNIDTSKVPALHRQGFTTG